MPEEMKVLDRFYLKGRGWVVCVDNAPWTQSASVPFSRREVEGIQVGVLVHQGDHSWRVLGVELFAVERKQRKMGLLVEPISQAPCCPDNGDLKL